MEKGSLAHSNSVVLQVVLVAVPLLLYWELVNYSMEEGCTVGKKTVRMFVNIQRLLNKSRTIEVTDLKFSGYTVLYVVYWPWKNHDININISHTINKTLIKHIRTVFLLLCCNSQYKIFHVQFYSCWPLNGFELNYISLLMNPNREQLKSTWFPYVLH